MSKNQNVGHQINPGTIILQWLTYAFWGWTILAMSVLTLYEHDAGRQYYKIKKEVC